MNLTKRLIYLAAVADTTEATFNARLRAIAARVTNDRGEASDYRSILASVSGRGDDGITTGAVQYGPDGTPGLRRKRSPWERAQDAWNDTAIDDATAALASEAALNLMSGTAVVPTSTSPTMIGVTAMARTARPTAPVDPIAGIASLLAAPETVTATLIAAYAAATGETGADAESLARRNAFLTSSVGAATLASFEATRKAVAEVTVHLTAIKARVEFNAKATATRNTLAALGLPEAVILAAIASLPGAPTPAPEVPAPVATPAPEAPAPTPAKGGAKK